jgi:hypothetical protein
MSDENQALVAESEDELLNLVGKQMEDAISTYIVQSQMWDRCDRNNFDNARKEIAVYVERAIEDLRSARKKSL